MRERYQQGYWAKIGFFKGALRMSAFNRLQNLVLGMIVLISASVGADSLRLTIQQGGSSRQFTAMELKSHPLARDLEIRDDPAYPGKVMKYRAVPVTALFKSDAVSADATLVFRCLDGFSGVLPRDAVLSGASDKARAYIAIEDPRRKWPKLKTNASATAGPFYLVWESPEKSGIGREQWPFQLAGLEVKPSLQEQFPALVPDSKKLFIQEGFQVFVKNCFTCHTLNGQGSSHVGPDLNQPLSPLDYLGEKYFRILVRDPQRLRRWPESKMTGFPPEVLSEKELDQLVIYLEHMRGRK